MVGKLLKSREVAGLLNVSVATLEKWRQRGLGPAFHIVGERAVRYDIEAVTAYLSEVKVGGGQ